MSTKPANKKLLVFGILVFFAGGYMTLRGISHTTSGTAVPSNRYEKASTGPENILFGLIIAGGGVFLMLRGWTGRGWPNQ